MPTFEELLREAKRPSENNFNSMLASIKSTARNQPWEDADYMTNTTGLTPDFYTGGAQPQAQQPEPTPMQPHFIQPEDVAAPSTDPSDLLFQTRIGSPEEDRANMASMLQQGQDMKNASMGGLLGGISNLGDAVYYAGDKLGLDGIANAGADFARAVSQKAADYNSQIYDNNLVNRTLAGAFSSLPYMLPGLGLGYIGGLGGKALAWTAGALSGSMETLGNTGQIQRELIDRGVDPEVARASANKNFLPELLLDTVTNRFGFPGNVDKILNPTLSAIAADAIGNFLQEPGQSFLSKAAEQSGGTWGGFGNELKNQLTDVENLKNVAMEEGVPAALSSIGMGLFGSAFGGLRQNRAQTPQEKQTIANVQKVQEAFANAAQAGHVYTAPGATENVGTATAAAPMPSTVGTGFEGVDISKGFSPTTTTTATLPGQLVPQGLSDIAKPSQGTISTAGYPLPGVIPTTAPTTPSGKPQQTVAQGNAAQVGQAIATTPQPAAQPTAQTPGDVTRVPVSVRGGTDENGNFVLGSDVGDAIKTLIGINGQQPTQSPQAPAQRPAAPANISRVVTPDGNTEIETHYAVVPAESLVTSNTPDFGVNQAYPAELQPRDRTRTANQTNVMNITRNLDPARLADSRLTSEGAPIVDANGVVESGNGRTLALMRGYREGAQTMQGYRQYLLDNAARLGLDPAQVSSVQNPVLVRVRDTQMTPEQRVAFANASNRSSIAGMSATEQARMDAGNLTNDILSQYNIEQPPSSTGQRNFHQAFLATIPENERGQLIDSKGQPTQALIRREQNALVYAATGDEQLAERMTESTDDNVRIVSNAIVQAAPTLARLNSEMRAGNLRGEYGIASDIATAANKLSQLRNEGQKVEDFLGQRHLFSDLELSEEALTLLEAFDKNKRYANRIRDALLNYARSVEMLGGPNEQNLFGDVTPDKIDLLRAAIDRATNGEGTQGTLFNRPEGNKDYAFIGQKGATAIDNARKVEYGDQKSLLHKLYDAQQMERNGEDKQKIWLATGWDRGIDGHWRYELLDGKLKNDQLIYANREYHLKDLYDMPALYEAYPKIADLVVRFKPLGRTYGQVVSWLSGKKELWMNSTLMADLKRTRRMKPEAIETLVHEVQHVIQDTEGFSQGGDVRAAKTALANWMMDYETRLSLWAIKAFKGDTYKVNAYKMLLQRYGKALRMQHYYRTGRLAVDNNKKIWDDELTRAADELANVHDTLTKEQSREAFDLEDEGAALYGLNGSSDWQKYAALLGESEARYIEQRLNFTDEQRALWRPSDYENVKDSGRILTGVGPVPAPLDAPPAAQTPTPVPAPSPAPAPKPAPKPAPTTGGFFGGQGTFGFGDGGGTQGTLFNRKESTVQTAKQIAAEVQDVRKQLVEDLKAAGRDEQSAKAEAQLVAAYFGRTANEARKAGMALSVRDQYERFKVEQGIAPQKGENVYEQPERDLTQTQEFKKWFGKSKAVDENGNPQVFYHGTPDGSFDEFRPGAYFTSAKEYADRYQNPSASSISTGKQAVNPKTYAVYLKTEKPFTLSDPKARRIFINEYIKGGNALGINPYLSNQEYAKIKSIDWTEGEDLKDFLQENGYDYDSILLDEGGDPDGSGGVKRRGDSYLVFSPEQIKSVSNRGTFDSSANIYHQTAASRTQDQTQTPAFKRWFGDSKVVDENGAPLVLYHQTAEEFSEFDPRHKGAGSTDAETPYGVFLKPTDKDIGLHGKTQMGLYARITNPFTVKDRSQIAPALKENETYVKAMDGIKANDTKYHARFEALDKKWSELAQNAKDRRYTPEMERVEAEQEAVLEEWRSANGELERQAKEALTSWLKQNGYDGMIIENDRGSFGRSVKTYIALDPNQVKSATGNRGTFDSSGNIYHQSATAKDQNNTLLATHGIDVRALQKAFATFDGQLPMPSLAIGKRGQEGTTHYGEITLIGDRNLIDPQQNRTTDVYDTDMWSPTVPRQEYKLDSPKRKEMSKIVRDIFKAWPNHKDAGQEYDLSNILGDRNASFEHLVDSASRANPFQAEFIKQVLGEEPAVVRDAQGRVDDLATDRALRDQLYRLTKNDTQQYYDWVDSLFRPLAGDAMVRVGRKMMPYTAENVLEAMRKKGKLASQDTFTFGPGKARAKAAKKLTSVRAMHKAEGQLAAAEDFKKWKDEVGDPAFNDAHTKLAAEMRRSEDAKGNYYNQFDILDDASRALADFASSKRSLEGITGIADLSEETKAAAQNYKDVLAQAKTEYFEAKPRRLVDVSEFKAAVIPSSTPAALRQQMEERGIKLYEYPDGDQAARQRITEQAAQEQNTYFQNNRDTPQDYSELRGQISFMDTGEATRDATITLFNSDRSTFVHEVGHKMLDDLVHLGQNPDAGAVFKQDLQVAMDWLGVKDASEIGTEQHERFARAFERYLMEGEAPTSKLAKVFEHFKQWLIDIYRNVANLDVELSPEVRDLFDRLLGKETATETRQSATITGPALTERGAAFQSQTGRDYSFGTGRSSSKQSSTKASEAQTLTSLRDIQNAVAELAPVRRGLSVRNKNVLGYFKRDAGVIRSRYSHDAETILHEAGHKLDQALKIRQSVAESQQAKLTDELCELGKTSSPQNVIDAFNNGDQDAADYLSKEGIAEFFRLYAYDRQQAETVAPTYAKMFNEILEKNPEYASTVRKILDTVQGYETQSDHQKVVSGIVRGEVKQRGKTWRESLRNGFEEFRRHWDDRGRPLQKMEQDVLKWAIKNDRQEMLVKDKNGTYHLKDEYAPYQYWRTVPGYQGAAQERVEAIVEPLRKLGEEKYEQLLDYIVSKRALDYYAAGMEPGIGLRSEDHTRAHIAEIEAAHPEIAKLANQLQDIYKKNTQEMMVGGGIWSQEEFDRLWKANPNYAPLMRVDDDGGMKWAVTGGGQNPVNASKGLKKKKGVGSDRAQMDVIDPINSMIHNILAFQKLSERNQVAQALVNAGEPMGLVEQVEGGEKDGGNTFHVWKDGKQNYYAADKSLIDTLQMLTQVVPQNQAMRIMSKASNILKMFATQLNPAFWAVNLSRDAMQVGITTQSNMAPLYQTYKGLKLLLSKDAESMRIKKLAAESGLFHSGVTEQDLHDAKAIDTYLRHVTGNETKWQQLKSLYKSTVGQWNENVEVAPKLAEFAYALKQGVPLREAAVRGREVNLDFDRGGVSAKQINPAIAFFNPALQGASKTIRTMQRFKTNPVQMLTKVGLYMMLPSLITWALGHDDDEYKRISREFKDRYWIFKVGNTWMRFPKPEGFGLFGSLAERLLDHESKTDPDAFRQMITTLKNNFLPNYYPTLFQPIIEHITGTSLFTGHDIIPRRLQDLPPEMQYTRNTSGLAKYIGRIWGISPIILDNYVKGYTAGAGSLATGLPDYILDKLGLSGEAPREERKWTEAPIISRFTVDPDRNSETIKRFYDYKRQTLVAKKGYQAHRKAGEAATADVDVRAADMFEKAGKKMSEMNKLYSQVQESRKYTPARKREILDGLRRRMNEIAQNALDRYYKLRG